MRAFCSFVFLMTCLNAAHAGVYAPAEPSPFVVTADGKLKELVYVPVFKSMLDDRFNALNPAGMTEMTGKPTFRGEYLKRRNDILRGPPVANPLELSAAYLRLGQFADAVNLLQPQSRSRNPNFVLLMNLAHAHVGRGEFDEAMRTHATALLDAEPPSTLPGYDTATSPIIVKIERSYYAKRLRQRRAEATQRTGFDTQTVPDLFDTPSAPIRWVNDKGEYEPGLMAKSERAKLPPDAVAIVQQLLLWSPEDTPLLWLLAELYAADGRLREAEQVFDQLTWGRTFTNRKILMEHRVRVREAVAKLPAESTELNLPEEPASMTPPEDDDSAKWAELREQLIPAVVIVVIFASVGVLLFMRSVWRWMKRSK